ncbi:MAG TPA: hypothetical protein VFU99_04110 [Gaiellaceae bacterium]|nr:hypothetical protein [Gaiellaceae bacterium]
MRATSRPSLRRRASVALHEGLGFRLVGRFERVAQLDGAWRDTVLLELRL